MPCGPWGPGLTNTNCNFGPFPVSRLSFESKEKVPAALVSASATPLFGIDPFTQPCTSGVISISRNWFRFVARTAVGRFPVADTPSAGGGVLYVKVFSLQLLLSWYTSNAPFVATASTYNCKLAFVTVAPAGTPDKLNWM